jgi:hypothetical protein
MRRWEALWRMHSAVPGVPPLWVRVLLRTTTADVGPGGGCGEVELTPEEWDDLQPRLVAAGFEVSRDEQGVRGS